MGTINLSQLTAHEMIKQHSGTIINTQAMARELSPYGIRVLSVAPGWVKTGMIDKPIEEIGSRLHMKGRIIMPEEIANAIWLVYKY